MEDGGWSRKPRKAGGRTGMHWKGESCPGSGRPRKLGQYLSQSALSLPAGSSSMLHLHILLLGITLSAAVVQSTVVEDILGLNKKSNEVPKGPGRLTPTGNFRSQVKRPRPPLSAPPYAVPMEPVFKYSQRDPLYEQKIKNLTNIEQATISSKADHNVESSNQVIHKVIKYKPPPVPIPPSPPIYGYYEPPEPIIEIIIKESNESLPAPTTQPPPPTTKEPIHVFYVKYKKNPHPSEHGDDIIYEEPVPALTPHATEIVEGEEPNYGPTFVDAPPSPPPSTTLRTIIRPDSETYHGSGLKVTFGSPSHHESHNEEEYGQSAPQPQVALPEKKKDAEVEVSTESNKGHYSKRQQGPFPTHLSAEDKPTVLQQPEYRPLSPSSQPSPTPAANHRFQGQPQQHYRQSDLRIAYNQQQSTHPTVPQPTDGFHNGQSQGRLNQGGPHWQSQHTKFHQPEQGPLSTRQPQYTDRAFLVPPQPPQSQPQNGPSLRIKPPSPPTPLQIQEYQRHKEYLHQQNLKQQRIQNNQAPTIAPTPQQIQISSAGRFHSSQPQLEQQQIQSLANRYLNNQQQQQQGSPLQGPHQQVQSTATRFSNNQQPSQPPQQIKTQIPHIHVETSPIIDQSQLSQHLNPQLQIFNQVPTTQNTIPQQFTFENKNYNDGTNYGLRLRGKNPQVGTRNYQQQHQQQLQHQQQQQLQQQQQQQLQQQQHQQQRHQQQQAIQNTYSQRDEAIQGELNRNQDKFENAEIIKSIPSLEEHQIQPGYKDAATDQIIPSTPNPIVSSTNRQQVDITQSNGNQQKFNYPHTFNQQRPVESRYTVRGNPQQNAQQTLRRPSQPEVLNYSIKSPSSTAVPTPNSQPEVRYNDRNKYLTVYSRPAHKQAHTKKTVSSTTARPEYRIATSPTPRPEPPKTEQTPKVDNLKEEEERKKANIAALPQEVPDDLREQLLSSGILGNADIQILDYDKVGDIPIESLPPEALENFYGAGSAPVPSIVKPNDIKKTVEMRVVRYDPNTDEGQDLSSKYFKENATKIDPVVLNDSKYKRYLPLKVSGSQFPIPDVPQLKDRIVNSVVVLAPVDYDFIKSKEEVEDEPRRGRVIQIQGVKFIVGDSLMTVIKEPTSDNYKKWLQNELSVPAEHQSVILLVTRARDAEGKQEIYMYDASSGKVTKLRGELSSAFVDVADSNSQSQDLDGLSSP